VLRCYIAAALSLVLGLIRGLGQQAMPQNE
jgi:hypothetical protein